MDKYVMEKYLDTMIIHTRTLTDKRSCPRHDAIYM